MMSFAFFAQGNPHGIHYSSKVDPVDQIADLLQFYGLRKWGFTVFRCTYGDDDAWARFMGRIEQRLRVDFLRNDCRNEQLAQNLDWNVHDDPASLDGASKDKVRHMFRKWVATGAREEFPSNLHEQGLEPVVLRENPRYNYCIHVDAEAMRSVLETNDNNGKPSPNNPGHNTSAYVNLIRADESWQLPDYSSFNWAEWEARVESEEEREGIDDGESEIEGSRLSDIGWMKVSVDMLYPDLYSNLVNNDDWENLLCRPPEVLTESF